MKKKVLLLFLSIFMVFIVGLLIVNPDPKMNHPYMIQLTDEDDNIIMTKMRNGLSSYVELEYISEPIQKVIVFCEDRNFYSHNGVDYKRVIKSAYENITSFSIKQGASTITQQLARLIYLDNSKNLLRKTNELIIAKRIERTYSKKIILELYLNNVYFGHNLYGIAQACEYYFNKTPSSINYKEASLLAAVINGPTLYSPNLNYSASLRKCNSILLDLYQNKIIDSEIYNQSVSESLLLAFNETDYQDYQDLYYYDACFQEAKKLKLTSPYYQRNGLTFKSNIDYRIQDKIIRIMKDNNYDALKDQISIIVLKPYSNKILSLIGGNDYNFSSYNRAIFSKRQIGSTIKPLVYYLGLKAGMSPLTELVSEPTTFYLKGKGAYSPSNAGNLYPNSKINMIEALGVSDNIYATKTTLLVGSSNLASLIKKFNIEVDAPNITMALGSNVMTPLELTSIYNTFASEGYYYPPKFLNQVSLQDGTILYSNSNKTKTKILQKDETIMINYLLRAPFDQALMNYAKPSLMNYQTNKRFAAKTGSTNNTNWVVGFNPNYTIGVYIGNDENDCLEKTNIAKKLFQEIANKLTENDDDIFYSGTNNLESFRLINHKKNLTSFTYMKKK